MLEQNRKRFIVEAALLGQGLINTHRKMIKAALL